MPQTNQANMPDDMNRDVTIKIRLTAVEHAAWLAAADRDEMTLSQWIRRRCNGQSALAPELGAAQKPRAKKGSR
jgi:hypothetical protein